MTDELGLLDNYEDLRVVTYLRNGGEAGVGFLVLDEVLEAPEHQHAHADEHEQEAQVLPAGPHCVGD